MLGELVGFRKLTFGDRRWRIVWRVGADGAVRIEITIAEVWAAGARADAEVYGEMRARLARLPESPATQTLAQVVQMLGRHAARAELTPAHEPVADPVPPWLRERLVHTVGLSDDEIDAMTGADAFAQWEVHITRER